VAGKMFAPINPHYHLLLKPYDELSGLTGFHAYGAGQELWVGFTLVVTCICRAEGGGLGFMYSEARDEEESTSLLLNFLSGIKLGWRLLSLAPQKIPLPLSSLPAVIPLACLKTVLGTGASRGNN
jgi:hypothetical protein